MRCQSEGVFPPHSNLDSFKRRNTLKRIAFALAAALLACSSLFAQQKPSTLTYGFVNILYPNDTFTQLLGVNDAGTIAGYHGASINKGFTLFLPNTFKTENYPGSTQTQVIAINNNTNVLTAGFYIDQAGINHGFLRNSNAWTNVDFPGTNFNQLLGLNDSDEAAGYYMDAAGNFHPYIYEEAGNVFKALTLPNTNSAQATGINDSGIIVGFFLDSENVSHGWELNGSIYKVLNFPQSTSTQALGINNNNEIVGSFTDTAGGTHGFHYAGGVWTQIDDPDGVGITIVNGINDSGTIVGFFTISTTVNTGFVGTPGE
jgi:probable HAF family extracellular repeat protein